LKENLSPYISGKQIGAKVEELVTRNSTQTPINKFIHGVGDEDGQFFFIQESSDDDYINQKRENLQITAPDPLIPKQSKTSFDDILEVSKKKRKAKQQWNYWQDTRESEYKKVKQIEKDNFLSPEQKKEAWIRFYENISKQNNPYSIEDEKMCSYSKSRISHWERYSTDKKHKKEIYSNLEETIKYLYLSDIDPIRVSNICGELQRDKVYWQNEIWIAGKYFKKGLGTHAPQYGKGVVEYRIPEGYNQFEATIGLARQDGLSISRGSTRFRIYVNNTIVYSSGIVRAGKSIDISILVENDAILRLEIDNGDDGHNSDHSTWGNARLIKR